MTHGPTLFAVCLQFFRKSKNFRKPLVPQQRPASGIHDQDPINRGVCLCFQKRGLKLKFGLRFLALRDVAQKSVSVEHSAFFVSRCRAVLHPYPLSVLVPEPVLDVQTGVVLKERLVRYVYPPKISWMNAAKPQLLTGTEVFLAVTQYSLHFRTDVKRVPVQVRVPRHVRRALQNLPKPLLAS